MREAMATVLRAERRARELSTQQLADAAGLSRSTIVRLENGTRVDADLDQLARIAAVFGVTPSSLMAKAEDLVEAGANVTAPAGETERGKILAWMADPATDPILKTRLSDLERVDLTVRQRRELHVQLTERRRVELSEQLRGLPPTSSKKDRLA